MRKCTVCFIRDNNKLLLALIEYSSTDKKWTGIGGFVEKNETLEDAVVRETKEETSIKLDKNHLKKVAEINIDFQLNVFLTETWSGKLKTKEPSILELKWFPINNLPYTQMHHGTQKWLPKVLKGKKLVVSKDEIAEVADF